MVSDCIPGVQTLLLIPKLTCIAYPMSYTRYVISVINAINDIFDALVVCHKQVQCMAIWVSKEALEPQECNQHLLVQRAKNLLYQFLLISFVFFKISFVKNMKP